MAKTTRVQAAASFHLGDRVRVKGLAGQVGRITELRGPLGPGGAAVYRVKLNKKPRVTCIEVLGNQLELLPPAGALSGPVAPGAPKAAKGR